MWEVFQKFKEIRNFWVFAWNFMQIRFAKILRIRQVFRVFNTNLPFISCFHFQTVKYSDFVFWEKSTFLNPQMKIQNFTMVRILAGYIKICAWLKRFLQGQRDQNLKFLKSVRALNVPLCRIEDTHWQSTIFELGMVGVVQATFHI